MDVIKVSGSSRTSAVAGAIAGVFREHKRAEDSHADQRGNLGSSSGVVPAIHVAHLPDTSRALLTP